MTKREFDRETKQNWRGPNMARDERCNYRASRFMGHRGSGSHYPTETCDYLTERMNETSHHRKHSRSYDPPFMVLGVGSRWRAPAQYRATKGWTLLTGRI